MMNDLPEDVRRWLLESGWHPNREVDVPAIVPRNHPAWELLRSFGGLTLLRDFDPDFGPTEEFVFGAFPSLHPATAKVWSELLNSPLVKIAKLHNDHGELYMDGAGRCFGNSLMHDAFYFCGDSFTDLLQGNLANRRHRPMLRPDQPSITLYGETVTSDDPWVYHYE